MDEPMQVFIGSLFGDGNIFLNKERCLSYSEIHSLKQKDYLLWKMNLMSKLFNFAGSPYMFDTYDKRTGKTYSHIKINASNTRKLKQYHSIFYKNGKKIIPKRFLYRLNELGLAVWYQDDGTYNYGGYRCSIATDDFSYEDHLLIQKFFKEKYNIGCKIYNKKDRFYIGFVRKESENFLKLIKSYIHKSMIYKLGHLDKSNDVKLDKANKKAKKRSRDYYNSHTKELINYQKEYRKKNPEKIKQQKINYYSLHKEDLKKYQKGYYYKNKKIIGNKKKGG